MRLFDPRLMHLLSFLTRRQAWLSPRDTSRGFRLDGAKITARTVHRWFRFLPEKAFVYYPHPRANLLGILPFASSFNVEVGLAAGEPFVSQGYWVPAPALDSFGDYWRAARDLALADDVDIFPCRNTHFIFSPFHELMNEEGIAEVRSPVDNA